MWNGIDVQAILIANLMGITVLLLVVKGHQWRIKSPTRENKILVCLFITCLVSCIMSPVSFLVDGKQGVIFTFLLWLSNTWLYLANILIALLWHAFVTTHLGITLSRLHKLLLGIPSVMLAAMLVINIFAPFVFTLNGNVYERTDMFWVYMAAEALIGADALRLNGFVRRSSGHMKLFPVEVFYIPAILGIAIQSVFYGVSAIYPFYAIAFSCVATALQNEAVYRDQLTGLYSRAYLTVLESKLDKSPKHDYTAMMLDVNNFKNINDLHGHNVGDEALVELANLLRGVTEEKGIIIRYAGDEFVIILYNAREKDAEAFVSRIHSELDSFNNSGKTPYKLSVSVGHCMINLKEQPMNEVVDKIDRLMYQNKEAFYRSNPGRDRRKR